MMPTLSQDGFSDSLSPTCEIKSDLWGRKVWKYLGGGRIIILTLTVVFHLSKKLRVAYVGLFHFIIISR